MSQNQKTKCASNVFDSVFVDSQLTVKAGADIRPVDECKLESVFLAGFVFLYSLLHS